MAAHVLRVVSRATDYVSKPQSSLYPYPLFMAIHAARISLVYRSKVRTNRSGGNLGFGADLAGFLAMAWGGSLAVNFLLGLTPPQLISPDLWIAYSSIHIAVSSFLYLTGLPSLNPTLEYGWAFLDALTRSGAIVAGVNLVKSHSNPAIANSVFTQLLIGAIAASGGGIVAGALQVWQPEWTLSTPPPLKAGNGVLSTLEIWSGALAAAIYGSLTPLNHSYAPLYAKLGLSPIFTPLGARSVVIIVLAFLYLSKTVILQQRGPAPRINNAGNLQSKRDAAVKKAQ